MANGNCQVASGHLGPNTSTGPLQWWRRSHPKQRSSCRRQSISCLRFVENICEAFPSGMPATIHDTTWFNHFDRYCVAKTSTIMRPGMMISCTSASLDSQDRTPHTKVCVYLQDPCLTPLPYASTHVPRCATGLSLGRHSLMHRWRSDERHVWTRRTPETQHIRRLSWNPSWNPKVPGMFDRWIDWIGGASPKGRRNLFLSGSSNFNFSRVLKVRKYPPESLHIVESKTPNKTPNKRSKLYRIFSGEIQGAKSPTFANVSPAPLPWPLNSWWLEILWQCACHGPMVFREHIHISSHIKDTVAVRKRSHHSLTHLKISCS
jgi:hypothetical protein